MPRCKWFELGILAPPLAKSLLIQLEDLYCRLAIEVHKLKASLRHIGCDPAPFGEFLDALTGLSESAIFRCGTLMISLASQQSHTLITFQVAKASDQFHIKDSL